MNLSVTKWWLSNLKKQSFLGKNLNVSQTYSKVEVYNDYLRYTLNSHKPFGVLMFWKQFMKELNFIETSTTITLPTIYNMNISTYNCKTSYDLFTNDGKSVRDWWNVCLANGRINNNEYKWNVNQSKKELYDSYKRISHGHMKGILMFWKYFTQLVNFVYEDYMSIQLPSLDECRGMKMDWKCELDKGFVPTHDLKRDYSLSN